MPDKTRKKRPEKREAPISYRPPSDLRDEFRARVEKSGLSVSAFITKAIFDKAPPRASRRPPIQQKTLAQILAQAAAIREQLSRIDDPAEDNRALLEQASEELALIRAALLKNMGRPHPKPRPVRRSPEGAGGSGVDKKAPDAAPDRRTDRGGKP